jgi:hypothetical protein
LQAHGLYGSAAAKWRQTVSITAGVMGMLATGALAAYLRARPLAAKMGRDGWRVLRPRSMLHAIALGTAGMSALPAYVLMNGGSQRADAAKQNVALWCLAIGFGLMTLLVLRTAYGTRVSWRDARLRVRTLFRTTEHDFAEITGIRKTDESGALTLTLRGGRRRRLSTYLAGLADFEESLADEAYARLFG